MSRIFSFFIVFILLLGFTPQLKTTYASDCKNVISYSPQQLEEDLPDSRITFTGVSNDPFRLNFGGPLAGDVDPSGDPNNIRSFAFEGKVSIPLSRSDGKLDWGEHTPTLERWTGSKWDSYCTNATYWVGFDFSERNCMHFRNSVPQDNEPFAIDIIGAPKGDVTIKKLVDSNLFGNTYEDVATVSVNAKGVAINAKVENNWSPGTYQLSLKRPDHAYFCKTNLTIEAARGRNPRQIPDFVPGLPNAGSGATFVCKPGENCSTSAGQFCDTPDNKIIKTAIGCIHTEIKAFIQDLLSFIAAVAGGIGFLFMIFGAFQMVTSGGNPDNLKAGQERFKDAVIGLLFLLLSILLLQIIGVDILKIPGFNP